MNLCTGWESPSHWSVISRRRQRDQWRRPAGRPSYTSTHRDIKLTARAQTVLGSNGVERFREFWSYENGWDFGGEGLALTRQSVVGMESFLAAFDGFGGTEPSLFLSTAGHLVLAWEDRRGARIEVEFGEGDATLFFASHDEGQSFNLPEDVASLVEAIPG